jgi:hypothetical protein
MLYLVMTLVRAISGQQLPQYFVIPLLGITLRWLAIQLKQLILTELEFTLTALYKQHQAMMPGIRRLMLLGL